MKILSEKKNPKEILKTWTRYENIYANHWHLPELMKDTIPQIERGQGFLCALLHCDASGYQTQSLAGHNPQKNSVLGVTVEEGQWSWMGHVE